MASPKQHVFGLAGSPANSLPDRIPKESASPSRHLSLGQLQTELVRVQELCTELRAEIDARWRLEPPKNGKGKGKNRVKVVKAQSFVEDRTLQVLGTAQNGEDLERILQQHQERVRTAQGVQRQLQEELQHAAGDARQLALGLPQLLDQRVSELKRQQLGVDELRARNQQRDSEISELKNQLAQLHLEASDLQGKTASMHLQHQRSAKLAMDAESEAQELQRQCLQVKQGTDEIQTTYLRSRLEVTQRLREEIPQWQSQVFQLEQLLAQQREKLKGLLEAQQLAQHLELQTLRRRSQIFAEFLRQRREESSWLRRLAEALEQDVAKRQPHQAHPPCQPASRS